VTAQFDMDLAGAMLPVGRVAVITGAGQGIGRVFAEKFAAAGAVPVVADVNAASAASVAAAIEASGKRALAMTVDVSDSGSVDAMVDQVVHRLGRIDVLINNAAIFSTLKMGPFERIAPDEWRRVIDVNLTGCFLCARAVVAPMRSGGYGRIINMSSGAVPLGRPNYLHYISAKAGLIGMTRSMARELGADGITVNAILPGATFTEVPRETVTEAEKKAIVARQCIHRPQIPEDLVGMALFLGSPASGFLTGQSITVDGGATHP
jgi:NAD(P)-dependent dehydrogenase (short-subunit alcohol dehydrogenase family)